MKVWRYPEGVKLYIESNAKALKDEELAENLNRLYPEYSFTVTKVRAFRKNHKIRNGRKCGISKGYSYIYPEGFEEFVKREAKNRTTEDLTKIINKEYGEGMITESQTRAYKKNHKITSGIDCKFKKGRISERKGISCEMPEGAKKRQFQKGHKPHNTKDLQEISKTKDGYLIIKVKEKGTQRERWQFLHRHIWEKEYGEIPRGKMVTFLDGNKENIELDNLALIDNEINLEMQRRGLRAKEKEITKTGINIAKLSIKTRECKRQWKKIKQ